MHPIMRFVTDYSVVFVGAVFLALVVSVYWPGRKERFQRDAMIPLRDDNSPDDK
jgi:cbb3-type cytochrome oxidase subunit 3